MHKTSLLKPDGRALTLYSRRPIEAAAAPSPAGAPPALDPHLRWHPLRAEWVAYAPSRQGRTFMPPPEYNPLAPTSDASHPTELPQGNYDIAVFDNRFPTLGHCASGAPLSIVATAPARGQCEVVVYTQHAQTALAALPLDHIELLLQVWADRTQMLAQLADVKFVLPFENRGAEVGVTLHHPHGQIYAYPFVPPVPKRLLEQESAFYREHGRTLLEDLIEKEIEQNERVLYCGATAIAFLPACARYPYEVWVAPRRATASFSDLDEMQRADLARALKTTLLKYDGLWQRPFPYLMAWFQAPLHGLYPQSHLHAEFYPPYRARDKLKFLAGTELAAGYVCLRRPA